MNKKITITWRDENYGAYRGCKAAYRWGYEAIQYGPVLMKLARDCGFEWCGNRAAFIARDVSSARNLVTSLERAGWTIVHKGYWEVTGPPAEEAY